jgi:hypothetical protein
VREGHIMVAGQRSKGLAGKGAAKGKKSASTGKKVDGDREETLQAVVQIFTLRLKFSIQN